MLKVEFSCPFLGKVEIPGSQDLCDMIEQSHKYAGAEEVKQRSRLHTTAYLLLTVAFSFFQAFPLGAKALSESMLHFYEKKRKEAKATLYDSGTVALKYLIFSVHQLFLTVEAFIVPSQVNKRVIVHKSFTMRTGLVSESPDDITNQLMHEITALRNQNALLRNQKSVGEEGLVHDLLERHETSEQNKADTLYRIQTELEMTQDIVKEKEREIEELQRQKTEQEGQSAEHIQEMVDKLEEKKRFWVYIKQELLDSWKEFSGKALVDRIEHIESNPHLYRRTLGT